MAAADISKEFVISRTFDAPRDLVWKAWTERDRIMQWFGPKGFTMPVAKLDFRPGGSLHYMMRSVDGGVEMWGKSLYREIVPKERIVWVNMFSDAQGGLGRHPLAPEWPQQMLTIATFEEPAPGRTTVTIRWSTIDATPEEQKTFDTGHDNMRMGWSGTFEQLEEYLAKNKAS
jgi:uncharacterized protein YndB with AHSA1/START domain